MKISIYNTQKDLKISLASVRACVKACLFFHNIETEEMAVHFVSQKKICTLHDEFFNDPSSTDCISFPSGFPQIFFGEIFICPQTAKEYVARKRISVYEEVTLYVLHGILHLLGFDDIDVKDRKKMRLEEKKLMEFLKKQDKLIKE